MDIFRLDGKEFTSTRSQWWRMFKPRSVSALVSVNQHHRQRPGRIWLRSPRRSPRATCNSMEDIANGQRQGKIMISYLLKSRSVMLVCFVKCPWGTCAWCAGRLTDRLSVGGLCQTAVWGDLAILSLLNNCVSDMSLL